MKRLFIFLLCLVWICTIYAQIQTEIMGCTLGQSSKSFVEQSIKSQGRVLEKCNEFGVYPYATFYDIKDDINFEGIIWDYARIRFIDGKFASILFHKDRPSKETYEKLKNTLINKYRKYQVDKYKKYQVRDNNPLFEDQATVLDIGGFPNGHINLIYYNKRLYGY